MTIFIVICCLLIDWSLQSPLIGVFPSDDGRDWVATSILEYSEDGDMIILGYNDDGGFIIKADEFVRIEEMNQYDAYGLHTEPSGFVMDVEEDEYYIRGIFKAGEHGRYQPYFGKIGSDLEVEWQKTIDSGDLDWYYSVETSANGIVLSSDRSYIYVSFSSIVDDENGIMKAFIGKYTTDGELVFLKAIGGGEGDDYIHGIALYPGEGEDYEGEGVVFVGESENLGDDEFRTFWGLLDGDGNEQWAWFANTSDLSTWMIDESQRHITFLSREYYEDDDDSSIPIPTFLITGKTMDGLVYIKINGSDGSVIWSKQLTFDDGAYELFKDSGGLAELERFEVEIELFIPITADYNDDGYDDYFSYFHSISSDDGREFSVKYLDGEYLHAFGGEYVRIVDATTTPDGEAILAGFKRDYYDCDECVFCDDDDCKYEITMIRTDERGGVCGLQYFWDSTYDDINFLVSDALEHLTFETVEDDEELGIVDLPTMKDCDDDDEDHGEDHNGVGDGWTVPSYYCWDCEDMPTCDQCEFVEYLLPSSVLYYYMGDVLFFQNYESDKDFEIEETLVVGDGEYMVSVGTTNDFTDPRRRKVAVVKSGTRMGENHWMTYLHEGHYDLFVDSSSGRSATLDSSGQHVFVLSYLYIEDMSDSEYYYPDTVEMPFVTKIDLWDGEIEWQRMIEIYSDFSIITDQEPPTERGGSIEYSMNDGEVYVVTTTPSGWRYPDDGESDPIYIPTASILAKMDQMDVGDPTIDKIYGRENYPFCDGQQDEFVKALEVVGFSDIFIAGETYNYGPGKTIWWTLVDSLGNYENPKVMDLSGSSERYISIVDTVKLQCVGDMVDSIIIGGGLDYGDGSELQVFLIYAEYDDTVPYDILWARTIYFPDESIILHSCFEICDGEILDKRRAGMGVGMYEVSYLGCWITSEDKKYPFLLYFDTVDGTPLTQAEDGRSSFRLDADYMFTQDSSWEGEPRVEVNFRGGMGLLDQDPLSPRPFSGFYKIDDVSYLDEGEYFPKEHVSNLFFGISESNYGEFSYMTPVTVNLSPERRKATTTTTTGRKKKEEEENINRRTNFYTGEFEVFHWYFAFSKTMDRDDVNMALENNVPEDQWNVSSYNVGFDAGMGGWANFHTPWSSERYVDWSCEGISHTETEDVCNEGFGTCRRSDFACQCDPYILNETATLIEQLVCDEPFCNDCEIWYVEPVCEGGCGPTGTCLENGTCVCTDEYVGRNCETPVCYGLFGDEVCYGHGSCESPDVCVCTVDDFYGTECGEEIHDEDNEGKSRECNVVLRFNYIVPIEILDRYNLTNTAKFDCCEFTVDCSVTKLDREVAYCYFDIDYDIQPIQSKVMVIVLGDVQDADVNLDDIQLTSLTDRDQEIKVIYEVDTIERETTAAWVGPTVGILIFLICLCCVLICCFFCFCVALSFFCFATIGPSLLGVSGLATRQRLKLKKFGELDDFNIILQEQKAEKMKGEGGNDSASLSINQKLFEIQFDEIKLLKVLGSGGSGAVVYLSLWQGKKVAFKVFKTRDLINNSQNNNFNEFEKEVSLISSLSHPNCLSFYGCSLKPPRIGIVMEFCENGDIHGFISIKAFSGEGIEEDMCIRMFEEIAAGMGFLHSRKIVHRDLKCENVLLDKSYVCKIMDFGLSRSFKENNSRMTRHVGTSYYMAPEICLGSIYSEKVDVYSFGIMLYEIWGFTTFPYGEEAIASGIEMRVAMNEDFRPDLDVLEKKHKCPSWLRVLMTRCWNHDPDKRPTFNEVIQTLNEESVVPERKNKEKEEEEKEEEEEGKKVTFEDVFGEDNGNDDDMISKNEHARLIREKEKEIEELKKKLKKVVDDDEEEEEESSSEEESSGDEFDGF